MVNMVHINRGLPRERPCNYQASIRGVGVDVLVTEMGGFVVIEDEMNRRVHISVKAVKALQVALGEALEARNAR